MSWHFTSSASDRREKPLLSATNSPVITRLTAHGRGAVATLLLIGDPVLLDGPELFHAANGRAMVAQAVGRVLFGRWGEATTEEVVVCRITEDRTEIHCHGGAAAISRIIDSLRPYGVSESTATFCDEPQLNVALQALSRAPTFRTAVLLHEQVVLRQQRSSPPTPVAGFAPLHPRHDSPWREFARHLTTPWKVVLCGPPNAGKSRLMNALLGENRSIVFDQPGTTRDALTATTACDGWPVEFVDTAGLRETDDVLEAAGISKALEHLSQADLALFVVDGSGPIPRDWLADLQFQLSPTVPRLWVLNKSDLGLATYDLPNDACHLSALTGDGVAELIARIATTLVPELPPAGTLLPLEG